MARKEATGAILASLIGGGGMGGGIGKRGQMGNVGGMTGGGARMGGMVQAPKAGFGGDPMLNPNSPINAPDKQLNAYIDDKMQQWLPTSRQKQDKLDTEILAKMMPQFAGTITPEGIATMQQDAATAGMSPQGQINLLGGAFGQLDAQRQREALAQQEAAKLELMRAKLATEEARRAKVNAGGSGGGKAGGASDLW